MMSIFRSSVIRYYVRYLITRRKNSRGHHGAGTQNEIDATTKYQRRKKMKQQFFDEIMTTFDAIFYTKPCGNSAINIHVNFLVYSVRIARVILRHLFIGFSR